MTGATPPVVPAALPASVLAAPAPLPGAAPAAPPAPACVTCVAPPAAPPSKPPQIPAAYANSTIEEILNSWTAALEDDAKKFSDQALLVAEHDGVLRDAQRSISELSDSVFKLYRNQESLDGSLQAVADHQQELESTLTSLEASVDEAFAARKGQSPQDSDLQRERACQRLIDADHRLASSRTTLDDIVTDLNASSERSNAEGSLGQIVQILNAHYNTLTFLEEESRGLEREIEGGGGVKQ